MLRQLSIWQEQKNPMVRMHNYLVTAKLGYLELSSLRIFLLMIAKLKWDDKDLLPVRITLTDVLPSYTGGSSLDLIIRACRELKSKMQDVEMLSMENGKTVYERMTVIDKVRYVEGTDYIEAHFGRAIKPYLIDLKEHFTTAELRELMKLKSTHAIRIYLLVKSIYRTGDTYSISVRDFKQMLVGDLDKYSEYKYFKKFILKPTQATLSKTSSAFEIEEERKGRAVEYLHIKPAVSALSQWQSCLSSSTQDLLKEHKVNLNRILEMVSQDEISEEYILYVVEAKLSDKKVKKPGGAIYDAIVNKHLWADFEIHKSKAKKPHLPLQLSSTPSCDPAMQVISKAQAEKDYEQYLDSGQKKYKTLTAYIYGLKMQNIIVEG